MDIYVNGRWVGTIASGSMYDLRGGSFVHLRKGLRKRMNIETYDLIFDRLADAYEWVCQNLPDATLSGCQYDPSDGMCKTIQEIVFG